MLHRNHHARMTSRDDTRERASSTTLGRPFVGEELFDAIADTVFFLKTGTADMSRST